MVGNDDDRSEVTLIPLEEYLAFRSPREKGAIREAESLKLALDWIWDTVARNGNDFCQISPAPTITVMTVNRSPRSFTPFLRLPQELQDLV